MIRLYIKPALTTHKRLQQQADEILAHDWLWINRLRIGAQKKSKSKRRAQLRAKHKRKPIERERL